MAKVGTPKGAGSKASPLLDLKPSSLQRAGTLRRLPLGLSDEARAQSVERLQQVLADTITLRDLYKKHHWQAAGPTFYQLHLLFDKHYEEQSVLVDALAERIQILGGVALGMPHDVAEKTRIARVPGDAEDTSTQLSRLLQAHESILKDAREAADLADDAGDSGTNDVLVSDVVRTNEMQVWFVAEHLVDVPLVRTEQPTAEQPISAVQDSQEARPTPPH